MFKPMAMTVIFALLTSLILTLTLMPVLAAIFLRGVSEGEPWIVRATKAVYRPMLDLVMDIPGMVLAATGLSFLASLLIGYGLGGEFIPKLDEGSLAIQAVRLPSVSLETSVEMTTRIEKCLMAFPEVAGVISKTGRPEIANDPMTVNLTDIIINLKPSAEWSYASKADLVKALEEALEEQVPGNAYSFSQPIELRVAELVAGVRSDVGISLYGDDLQTLRDKAEQVVRSLSRVPGAADVQAEQTGGLPYLRVVIQRNQIARYGLNARDVLDAVSIIGGREVGQVYEGQRRFPLMVRLAPEWRGDFERIKGIQMADGKGRHVTLSQVADLRLEDGPAQISRDNVRRRTIIQCNVRGRDLAGFVNEARATVEREVKLPAGYMLTWGGQFKNLEEATKRLMIAVPIALFLIVALLQMTFNSARLAGLIFLNVPLAATGGILALWLRGLPFSISAGVGFIALFGVAVLNGVVLVTCIVDLRKAGMPARAAAREGAMTRVRPVLMTALVAMLGFIPMAISTDSGAEVQRPLATVVIGGLITSTLLTLLVLPAIYRWFDPPLLEAQAGEE